MAVCTLNKGGIYKALDMALEEWSRMLVDEIVKITPRDPTRPPLDPSRKVTGNLKRSVNYERIDRTHYKVWVQGAGVNGIGIPTSIGKGASPAEYGYYLEYWTVRMKPRSFVRKALFDQREKVITYIQKIFNRLLS